MDPNYCLPPQVTIWPHNLWPWYVTFDLNKWEFPCGNYDSSLAQLRPIIRFQPILQLDLVRPLTLVCDLWYQQMRIPMLELWLKSGWNPSKYAECRTFDLGMWPLISSRNDCSHVAPMTQVFIYIPHNFMDFNQTWVITPTWEPSFVDEVRALIPRSKAIWGQVVR